VTAGLRIPEAIIHFMEGFEGASWAQEVSNPGNATAGAAHKISLPAAGENAGM
jgi:hypothetical protein